VGSETHQVKKVGLCLAINKHEVRLEVAISMVAPFTCQRMVTVQDWKGYICDQKGNDGRNQVVEVLAVPPGLLPFVVALEAAGVPDFTH
jgi:hypothetical protein